MMAHMIDEKAFLQQALLMESYGANCIYCTDSAGYMLPEVGKDFHATASICGFHGHHNLAMGVANSLAGIEAGASDRWLSGRARRGCGQYPPCGLHRMGAEDGIDLYKIMDVAEDPHDGQPIGWIGTYNAGICWGLQSPSSCCQACRGKIRCTRQETCWSGRRGTVGGAGRYDRRPCPDHVSEQILSVLRSLARCLFDFRGLMFPATIGPQITLGLFPNSLLCSADIRLDDLLFGQLPRRFDNRYQA